MTKQKKILIVDDEQDLRDALSTTFTYEGFSVVTAENGEEGLARACEEKPDIILLDVLMPKLDGMSMLKKLREDAWGKDVHVIIMTVSDDMGHVAEMMEMGGTEYLLKSSMTLADIVQKVKHALGVV